MSENKKTTSKKTAKQSENIVGEVKVDTVKKTTKPKVEKVDTVKKTTKPKVEKVDTVKKTTKPKVEKVDTASKTTKPKVEKVDAASKTTKPKVEKVDTVKKTTKPKVEKVDTVKKTTKPKVETNSSKINFMYFFNTTLKRVVVLSTLFIAVLVVCTVAIVSSIEKIYSDDELKDMYEDMYGDYNGSLDGLTDEQLNSYYENLYGTGNNDLTIYDEFASSSNTVYHFDMYDDTYIEYMALNYGKAYMIRDASLKVTYLEDHQGDTVSLLTESGETEFEYGIAIAGAAACYTYTDIKEQGYEKFSGYFGAHYLARYTNSTATSFRFRFVCDGEYRYTTQYFSKDSQSEYVEIDLDGVEVFQIVVDINGSGTGDYMGMGDPKFTKEKATAYLDVFDLEFNLPSQVTRENILQYAKAYDINNNDISEYIDYETNYVTGSVGEFEVTYIIQTEVKGETVERRDTVKLDVYNIDYTEAWTLENYKTPYVNYLYHPRQTYSSQMKKLFDLLIDYALDFDDSLWTKKYRSNIYTSQNARQFNLASEMIYLKYSDVNKILSGLWDCEPRVFMLLDVDLMGSYYSTTNSTTGLTSHCWFWAQNLTTEQYDARAETIIANSETFLSAAKDDMTYAQKWKYVTDAYQSKMSYTDGANLYNSMGLLKAKCNGNSQGLVFLAQRLSMQSIYANGMTYAGFHAWTYQKLPDNNTWYLTDKLWYSTLWNVSGYTSSHSVYTNTGYTMPDFSPTAYSTYNYTYPSIWATFANSSYTINYGTQIDVLANRTSTDGIFDDILLNYKMTYLIKDADGSIVDSNTANLSSGSYVIHYTLNYTSNLYNINREYTIALTVI